MAAQWFVQEHGVESGPFSSAEIKSKAASGDIAPETQIRPGNGEWMSASKISGLIFGTKKPDKRKCISCGQEVKLLERDLGGSGLCPKCRNPPQPKFTEKPEPLPALAPCPDCGKTCSRRAIACPACGCPVSLANPSTQASIASIVAVVTSLIGIFVVISYTAFFDTTKDGVYNIGLIARQHNGVAVGIGMQILAAMANITRVFGLQSL